MPSSSRAQEKSVSRLIERLCNCKTEISTVERCRKMGIEVAPISLEDMADPELRPCYFRATPSDFMEQHPINQKYLQGLMKEDARSLTLREYDPEVASKSGPTATLAERIAANPAGRVRQITRILDHYICHVVRDNMPYGYAMVHVRGWSYACESDINPLAMAYYAPTNLIAYTKHRTVTIYEMDNHRMPHVAIVTEHFTHQETDEKDLYVHELVSILKAMSIRYSQPEFEQYKVIPVLLLSFMSPQNGRILEANLDERNLIVRRSPMYSFKTNRDAPFELFSRWLLGDPIGMTSITEE
ncbi:hypothetical protein BDV36DRAFT_302384 [Aspergillus pseudocaelatus]|uniref:Uncharacterized protein n=1 Tax=Aspergillus pseudocaelatus TaxID=1825620 RepID=A0ABQ6W133_9EURO|nr:hypothetical protein BDV36DRAFT_302384 [Aspergillus pseudocaelatus]